MRRLFISALPFGLLLLILSGVKSAGSLPQPSGETTNARMFMARGVVKELNPDGGKIVISHEVIPNYMAAMTMPFKVKDPKERAGLHRGDEITFRLHVADTESWVDQITKIGTVSLPPKERPADSQPAEMPSVPPRNPLLDCQFTNELGRAVSLNDFHGQALAITFFYTRCPLPDYCPRLSKNFQEAQQKLESEAGAPTNWHFLSISFDTEFDTPTMLKTYGESYQYDPKHWSFLTGPADKIGELARQSGVTYQLDDGTFNHNFRTLIVDANGHLQMVFPTSGDLSDEIVAEIIKAAMATNQPVPQNQNQ
ncbi:MAG: SCO family protein [Verrucomicrobiota bacterium]